MPRVRSFHKSAIAIIITSLFLGALISACIVQSGGLSPAGIEGTLDSFEGALSYQATELAAQATMIAYLATRGPGMAIRSPSLTPTPYLSVIGSVVIEEGRCCAGGVAGQTIELSARFEASSPFGEITHMRVHTGSGPQPVDGFPASSVWEPYRPTRTFSTKVGLNWTGFFVSVQFRDAAGNISPIVWDEISIEGMAPPTP